jgi:GcrA cell cycle regulator
MSDQFTVHIARLPPAITWITERVDRFKQLWNLGLSASDIAAELGHGITRNAVLGKAHRMGLSSHKPMIKPRKEKPLRIRLSTTTARQSKPPTPIADPVVVPTCTPVTFAELADHHCRYPIGDGPILFCGAHKMEGFSYCGFHYQRCHVVNSALSRSEYEIRARLMAKERKARAA